MIFVTSVLLVSVNAGTVPSHAQDAGAGEATAVLDRITAFLRAHPRMRGRFEHRYLDRDRTVDQRSTGRFAMELPRIGITYDGADPRRIAVDATTARVLVPREGEAPLVLAFRIDTTPLPPLLAVIAGTTPLAEVAMARRIEAEGDDVVELRPTDASAQVDRVWIDADASGAVLRVMIVDWRGATHRVVLRDVRYPATLPATALAPAFPSDAIVVEP